MVRRSWRGREIDIVWVIRQAGIPFAVDEHLDLAGHRVFFGVDNLEVPVRQLSAGVVHGLSPCGDIAGVAVAVLFDPLLELFYRFLIDWHLYHIATRHSVLLLFHFNLPVQLPSILQYF